MSSSSRSFPARRTHRSFLRSKPRRSTSWARRMSSRLHLQFWFFLVRVCSRDRRDPVARGSQRWCSGRSVLLVLVAPRIVRPTARSHRRTSCSTTCSRSRRCSSRSGSSSKAPWQLVSATIFLGAAMLTKREGLLLAACVLVAALAASLRRSAVRVAAARARRGGRSRSGHSRGGSGSCRVGSAGELPNLGLARSVRAPESGLARAGFRAQHDCSAYDLWLVVLPLAGVAVVARVLGGASAASRRTPRSSTSRRSGIHVGAVVFTELELPIVQDEGVNPIVRLTGIAGRPFGRSRAAAARRGLAGSRAGAHGRNVSVRRPRSWADRRSSSPSRTHSAVLAGGAPSLSVARATAYAQRSRDSEIDAVFGYFDTAE